MTRCSSVDKHVEIRAPPLACDRVFGDAKKILRVQLTRESPGRERERGRGFVSNVSLISGVSLFFRQNAREQR